jgi:branched-chain amino acid transport system ATP-binding protein
VLGLTPARGGTIALRGRRIERLRADQIARLGVALVPEGRQIFPNLTVRENLVAFARPGAAQAWNLKRVLELFPSLERASGWEISCPVGSNRCWRSGEL